jgi:hypothetical protein
MKRRDFLFGGGAAAATASARAQAASAAKAMPPPKLDPDALEKKLSRIDARMAELGRIEIAPREPESPEEEELFAGRAKVSRTALRSLYFVGAFMDLEEHDRVHPGVQERMRRLQPEMDEACEGMASMLEAMTPEEHRAIQKALKEDPDAGLRIGERLDQIAKEDGFGFGRRLDMRLAVDDVTKRLKAQNPQLVLEPITRKVRRVQQTAGTELERERTTRVKAGEQAFWEMHERNKKNVQRWDDVYASRPRVDLVALEDTYPEQREHPEDPTIGGTRVLRVGGYLFGIGMGVEALGGLFYLASVGAGTGGASGAFAVPAVILGTTIGPLLMVGGLVVLLVGAIIYTVKSQQLPADAVNR